MEPHQTFPSLSTSLLASLSLIPFPFLFFPPFITFLDLRLKIKFSLSADGDLDLFDFAWNDELFSWIRTRKQASGYFERDLWEQEALILSVPSYMLLWDFLFVLGKNQGPVCRPLYLTKERQQRDQQENSKLL